MRRKKDKSNGITALYERLSRDDDKADFINIQEGAYSAESQSISKVYDIKDKIKNMDLWKKLIFLFFFCMYYVIFVFSI